MILFVLPYNLSAPNVCHILSETTEKLDEVIHVLAILGDASVGRKTCSYDSF